MSFSKSELFSINDQKLSSICKALGHPARIHIIRKLFECHADRLDYKTLSQDIPLHQSTISKHLGYLLKVNIIGSEQEKAYTYYHIIKQKRNVVATLFQLINASKIGFSE